MEIKRKIALLAILFAGCATVDSYTQPGTDFTRYRKIAVVEFDSSLNRAAGQEVADVIALEFIKKGFNVIERSQLKHIANEEALRLTGVTDKTRSDLQLKGINGIIMGTLTRYDCKPDKVPRYFMGKQTGVKFVNDCHVSLSLKLVDVNSGDILWAGNGSYSLKESKMTARKVLAKVLRQLRDRLPSPVPPGKKPKPSWQQME